jgi:RimJ/RimL family protein N-acetyltransferase
MQLVSPDPNTIDEAANRLAGTQARRDHLSRYSYQDIPFPSELAMRQLLSATGVWMIVTGEGPVGFILYPARPHAKSFGMAIALDYCRRGYARAALREFVARCPEFGIRELNGYCRNDNAGMIATLKACGFQQVAGFEDHAEPRALRFAFPL